MAFTAVLALASLLTSAAALRNREWSRHAESLQFATLLSLLLALLLIVKLHLSINSIQITLPGGESFRFYVAPWTESEKPLFWSLLLGIFSASLWRREGGRIAALTSTLFATLVLLTVLLDPPLPEPLPTLQGALEAYSATGATPAIAGQLQGLAAFYGSSYMWVHPPTLFLSYASLVVALAGSLLMVTGRRGWRATYPYAAIGYVALTGGLLFGYPWAVDAWGDRAWWWDPKIGGSLMMWSLYTAYLHLGLYHREHRRWTGAVGILCFLGLAVTYLLTYLVQGVHTVG